MYATNEDDKHPFITKCPGHPNTRLFITHGGVLGLQEAVYCGVPILGMPLYGDQHLNIAYLVEKGLALRLNYWAFSFEQLWVNLNKLLADKR